MPDKLDLFLIEDDDDVAVLMRKCLERAGHRVTRCRTAADALIVLGQTTFDLALLDQQLPDMEGVELLGVLARENVTIPILMVTGYGNEDLAARVLRAGALDYVVKDHSCSFLVELPKRVAESVSRHRLVHMNRLLIQALESARDGVLITDLQGTILHVNQALESVTGYSRDELLGKTPALFKSGVHPPEVYQEMWRAILNRESWQGELTNRRKDGTFFEVSLTVSPIFDAHVRLTHFVGIQRDVTSHKQLERQLRQAQKMQSVGTLAGGVAHEFNNLLAGINGYASLGLRETSLDQTLREFLQSIVDLSERAALLTRQLLAFARKPALIRRPTPIPELVRNTADLVTRTMQQDAVLDIHDRGENGALLIVEADGNQLQQALINLALNSRDAVKEREALQAKGGPASPTSPSIIFRVREVVLTALQLSFPQNVPPGRYVVIEVEDAGQGMSLEVLNQALDPFFTTKEVGQGTGLGLPVVFGIIQGHQGFLTLRSEVDHGSCVSLYLPLLETPEGEATSRTDVEAGMVVEPETSPGYHILVVDDEEAVLDVVRRFLQIAGHHVTCVTSGQQAIELLREGKVVDLVILDLMMPRENSALTFQRLRERKADLPILLCTGLIRDDAPSELLGAGAVGLLRKPFRMTELWHAVKSALGR
jgi:PAS domain S-box-containing protein